MNYHEHEHEQEHPPFSTCTTPRARCALFIRPIGPMSLYIAYYNVAVYRPHTTCTTPLRTPPFIAITAHHHPYTTRYHTTTPPPHLTTSHQLTTIPYYYSSFPIITHQSSASPRGLVRDQPRRRQLMYRKCRDIASFGESSVVQTARQCKRQTAGPSGGTSYTFNRPQNLTPRQRQWQDLAQTQAQAQAQVLALAHWYCYWHLHRHRYRHQEI